MIGVKGSVLRSLGNKLRHIFDGWLTPKDDDCISCSKRYGGSGWNGLCPSCANAIPWVSDLQCAVCGRYERCTDCGRREDTQFVHNRSAVQYNEMMKEWLAVYKYRGHEKLRPLFGHMLLHAYRMHERELAACSRMPTYVTFVPLSRERLQERGFNQAEQLAVDLGKAAGLPVIPLLSRTRHTEKQSYQTRKERLDNMKGAFAVDANYVHKLRQAHGSRRVRLLIVDDVYTTGSTLNHCSRTLKEYVATDIYGISWAR